MSAVSIEFDGINELKESFNRIPKDIALGLGIATAKVQQALKHDLIGMYNFSESRFNNALVGSRTTSTVTRGKNLLENGIEFKQIPIDLAKFPYTWEWGNIPPLPKKRQGKVHSVAVRRGNVKVVYGKYGYGGFTLKNGPYGVQMFERISTDRFPLRLAFGPSIADTIMWGVNRPGTLPTFDKEADNMTQYIADQINL